MSKLEMSEEERELSCGMGYKARIADLIGQCDRGYHEREELKKKVNDLQSTRQPNPDGPDLRCRERYLCGDFWQGHFCVKPKNHAWEKPFFYLSRTQHKCACEEKWPKS